MIAITKLKVSDVWFHPQNHSQSVRVEIRLLQKLKNNDKPSLKTQTDCGFISKTSKILTMLHLNVFHIVLHCMLADL